MLTAALLFAFATLSPSPAIRLADAPVLVEHSARLLEIDSRLASMTDSWSDGSKITAITAFSAGSLLILVSPILFTNSLLGVFIGAGLVAFGLAGLMVGAVACIVGAVGLSNRREERAKLLEERALLETTPCARVPVHGVVLARW